MFHTFFLLFLFFTFPICFCYQCKTDGQLNVLRFWDGRISNTIAKRDLILNWNILHFLFYDKKKIKNVQAYYCISSQG